MSEHSFEPDSTNADSPESPVATNTNSPVPGKKEEEIGILKIMNDQNESELGFGGEVSCYIFFHSC